MPESSSFDYPEFIVYKRAAFDSGHEVPENSAELMEEVNTLNNSLALKAEAEEEIEELQRETEKKLTTLKTVLERQNRIIEETSLNIDAALSKETMVANKENIQRFFEHLNSNGAECTITEVSDFEEGFGGVPGSGELNKNYAYLENVIRLLGSNFSDVVLNGQDCRVTITEEDDGINVQFVHEDSVQSLA